MDNWNPDGQANMRPGQMPDFRHDLIRKWEPGNIFEYASKAGRLLELYNEANDHSGMTGKHYSEGERIILERASLYWVSSDMTELIVNAMDSIPDDVTTEDLIPPSSWGLVYFDHPIVGIASHVPLGALSELDRPDEKMERIRVDAISWGTCHLAGIPRFNISDTDAISISSYQWSKEMFDHGFDGWLPLGKSDWPRGDALSKIHIPTLTADQFKSFTEDRRLVAAIFSLLLQEGIAQTETHKVDRAARRRSERAGYKSSDVSVVQLRRIHHTRPDGEPAGPVKWASRWPVKGHWRWQAYGEGRALRKLIFIHPYIKGPDDAPLKIKEKVNAWVR